jgi:hypothetical protein
MRFTAIVTNNGNCRHRLLTTFALINELENMQNDPVSEYGVLITSDTAQSLRVFITTTGTIIRKLPAHMVHFGNFSKTLFLIDPG